MRDLFLIIVLGATLVSSNPVFAVPAPPAVHAEIEGLLQKLEASGCRFNRNGSWYSASEARAHLSKKLDYLEGKDMIKSTDDFIRLAASTSSMSGKPYLVQCEGAAAVESKAWLNRQLEAARATK